MEPYVIDAENSLPNLLVNRLYLNLKSFERSTSTNVTTRKDGAAVPELVFAQNGFLGNIGAPLDTQWLTSQFNEEPEDNPHREDRDGLRAPSAGDEVVTLYARPSRLCEGFHRSTE